MILSFFYDCCLHLIWIFVTVNVKSYESRENNIVLVFLVKTEEKKKIKFDKYKEVIM